MGKSCVLFFGPKVYITYFHFHHYTGEPELPGTLAN